MELKDVLPHVSESDESADLGPLSSRIIISPSALIITNIFWQRLQDTCLNSEVNIGAFFFQFFPSHSLIPGVLFYPQDL